MLKLKSKVLAGLLTATALVASFSVVQANAAPNQWQQKHGQPHKQWKKKPQPRQQAPKQQAPKQGINPASTCNPNHYDG